MQLVGVARVAEQLSLDLGERVRVDQVARLLHSRGAEITVERERLGPPLRGRRVVLVHVGGDVVEEERGGEGEADAVSTSTRSSSASAGP